MLFRDTIDLITLEDGVNENGFVQKTETKRDTIFANRKSIRSNEFYFAAQNGFKLEIMFVIRTFDYNNQIYLDYENSRYQVVRTYETGDFIELVCKMYDENP